MEDNSEASFNDVSTVHLISLFSEGSLSAPPFHGYAEKIPFDITTFASSEQPHTIQEKGYFGTLVPIYALLHFDQG